MRTRARHEDGFLLVELIAAMLILSIALLALVGAYSLGFYSVGAAAKTSAAGLLANNQLELYSTLPYASIGLDATTLASVKSSDANYSTDESGLSGSSFGDVTISGCGSSAQCSPVQTVTGADHKSYKIETFIRHLANANVSSTRLETIVTVIVRSMSVSGSPIVVSMQTAFDQGTATSSSGAVISCASSGPPPPPPGTANVCESLLTNKHVVNNTTLTLVYMDDGPMLTTGSYAPTAYLNGVVPLSLVATATSGYAVGNFVDAYGGSAQSTSETLLTITLPSGLSAGSYTILVGAYDTDGPDVDQYSWPITVASNGTVTG